MATEAFEQLLVVQDHDTRATQLRTRRRNLPERTEAVEVAAALAEADARWAELDAERHRLDRDQSRLDDEVASLRAKADHADKAMYGGSVTNPRELQALQDEGASLTRRIGELEDQELEIMVEREPVDEEIGQVEARQAELRTKVDDVAARLTVAEAEVDAELAAVETERAAAAAKVPDALLSEYEGLRESGGGIGAARLEHGTCQGCHMQLSAVEIDRIKALPDDAAIHCEECGRILVR
jgi:predicted  nucleic acid-binding Zn-ribbon protein